MKIEIADIKSAEFLKNELPEALFNSCDFVIMAMENESIKGIMCVALEGTNYRINYVYVTNEYRNLGVARAMFDRLNELSYQSGIDASVISYSLDESTEELHEMLMYFGYEEDGKDSLFTIKLQDADFLSKYANRVKYSSLEDSPSSYVNRMKADYAKVLDIEDMPLPLLKPLNMYSSKASILVENPNTSQISAAFVEDFGDNKLSLSFVFSQGDGNPKDLLVLMGALFDNLCKICPKDAEIYINSINGHSNKMIVELLGEKAKQSGVVVTQYYTY